MTDPTDLLKRAREALLSAISCPSCRQELDDDGWCPRCDGFRGLWSYNPSKTLKEIDAYLAKADGSL